MPDLTTEQQDAIERMLQYNSGRYHEDTNPFGFAGDGYQSNWSQSLQDAATVAGFVAAAAEVIEDADPTAAAAAAVAARDTAIAKAAEAAASAESVDAAAIDARLDALEAGAGFAEVTALVRYLLLRDAERAGEDRGLFGVIRDSFQDATGVDAGASTNAAYNADGHYWTNAEGLETVSSLPAMTSNTTPSGYVAADSANTSGDAAWKAFDKSAATRWSTESTTVPGWVSLQTPAPIKVWQYKVTGHPSNTAINPSAWALQGSNDGSSWTPLDTRSGVTTWSAGETKVYSVTEGNRASYNRHRINVTTQPAGAVSFYEVELLLVSTGIGPGDDMALVSAAFPTVTPPGVVSAYLEATATDAPIDINDNVALSVSRDDGGTWTAVELSLVGPIGGGIYAYMSGPVDISGQPSGSDIRWRITTMSSVGVRIHNILLQTDADLELT